MRQLITVIVLAAALGLRSLNAVEGPKAKAPPTPPPPVVATPAAPQPPKLLQPEAVRGQGSEIGWVDPVTHKLSTPFFSRNHELLDLVWNSFMACQQEAMRQKARADALEPKKP